MMKKYFLFDLDGTLADTGAGITESVQRALAQLGWPPQKEEFLRQFVGPPLEESFREFCGMDEAETRRAIRLYRAEYSARGLYKSPLYPGIPALLEELSRRAALCVATSKREEGARKILGMRGIEDRFTIVVGDDGSRPSKSQVIGEVLRLLGNPPAEQAVMIGDRSYDVAGARAWGMETIGAAYGYGTPEELQAAGAEYLAESVEALGRLCAGLAEFQGGIP